MVLLPYAEEINFLSCLAILSAVDSSLHYVLLAFTYFFFFI